MGDRRASGIRGEGIGNRLMGLVEDWLSASGCKRAWLTTDVDTKLRAYGFYRWRGWTDWKVENGFGGWSSPHRQREFNNGRQRSGVANGGQP